MESTDAIQCDVRAVRSIGSCELWIVAGEGKQSRCSRGDESGVVASRMETFDARWKAKAHARHSFVSIWLSSKRTKSESSHSQLCDDPSSCQRRRRTQCKTVYPHSGIGRINGV